MTPALADKLAKLLRLLCDRSHDGETLAAASKLSALVVAHDVDWDETLGGSNGHELTQQQLAEVYQAGIKAGVELERNAKANGGDWGRAGTPRTAEVGNRLDELETILAAAEKSRADGNLAGWYANFSSDMQERVDEWGNRTFVSENQWQYLNKLRSILERTDYL